MLKLKYSWWVLTVLALVSLGVVWFAAPSAADAKLQTTQGSLRVVNALVGLSAVDLYIDGLPVALSLEVEQASPYAPVPVGDHTLELRVAGLDATLPPITSAVITITPGVSISAITYLNGGVISLFVMNDDRTPLALGRTRLAALHLHTELPAHINITYPSKASLMEGVTFGVVYGPLDLDAGLYRLMVVDADSPEKRTLFRAGEFSFYGGTLYTLIVVADSAGTPHLLAVAAPVESASDGMRLRLIHAAPNTEVVDVYVDERLVAPRMNFGLHTEYINLEPYSHIITLRSYNAPAGSPPLAWAEFNVTAENLGQRDWSLFLLDAAPDGSVGIAATRPQDTLVAAVDPAAAPVALQINPNIPTRGETMAMALYADDVSRTPDGFARLRLVHALVGSPSLSVYTAYPVVPPGQPIPAPISGADVPPSPQQLVQEAIYGSEAGEAEIPAGYYQELDVSVAFSGAKVAHLNNIYILSGRVYTVVVLGSNQGSPPLQVLEFVDYGAGESTSHEYVGTVIGDRVNVRSQPRQQSDNLISSLVYGTTTTVLGRNETGAWVRVTFTDPSTGLLRDGWISADLMRVTRLGVVIRAAALPVFPG